MVALAFNRGRITVVIMLETARSLGAGGLVPAPDIILGAMLPLQ